MRAFDRFSQPVDKTRRDSLPSGQVVVKYGRRFFFFSFFFLPAYISKNEITITNGALSLNLTPRSVCIVILGFGANFSPIILIGSLASTDPSTPPVSPYIFTRYGRGPRRKFAEFQLTRARVSRNLSGGVVKQSRALAVEFLFRRAGRSSRVFREGEKKKKKGGKKKKKKERRREKVKERSLFHSMSQTAEILTVRDA